MTRSWWLFVFAVLATACGEAESETATAQPAPVAPVEVTGEEGSAPAPEGDEVAALRARVAELEQQLAACQGPAGGTQTAAIPEGADVPAETPEPVEPAAAATNTQGTTRDAGTRARRQGDPSLIDTILGEDGRRRRRRDDEPLELPNPANILLGQ